MIRFATVQELTTPRGKVMEIQKDGKIMWSNCVARYVSFGDSIAAGHAINSDWEKNYGTRSQYGNNGNTKTVIVPNSYTDLIHRDLTAKLGGWVKATSFAKSGDRVDDLIRILDHDVVKNTVAQADYVTLCIGANDVLEPAMSHLEDYINYGDLSELENIVETNLAILNDDSNSNSYMALFNKLSAINPNAKYVFTTIYNPYKYLWLEEGRNGFLGPLLDLIPTMHIDIDEIIEDRFLGGADLGIELGINLGDLIREGLLNTSAVKTLFQRVNGLCDWSENFVTKLNEVLRNKIAAYQAVNSNFFVADTKAVYDGVPDRPITASKHYNDLVNVEFTRGYDVSKFDWGALWRDEYGSGAAAQYWLDLAWKYLSFHNAFPSTNVLDYVSFDIGGFASDFVSQFIEKIIVPNVDPHPEEYGQYVLKRSFVDTFGLQALDRHTVIYVANGGSGSMAAQTIVGVDGLPVFTKIKAPSFTPATGYYFTGWNTSANGDGTAYSSDQLVGIAGNMTLYAQWSNIYTVTVRHSEDSTYHGDGDTGPMDCYALWIDGVEQPDLGAFSNGARVYNLPYGTPVGVIAQTDTGEGRSYITWNGTKIAGNSSSVTHDFTVTSHMDIHFEWDYWLAASIPPQQSYWICHITTS